MTADDVKAAILSCLEPLLRAHGVTASTVSNDLDLREQGLVDSLGFLQLITDLQVRLGRSIDLHDLDPAELTRVGSLSRHIATSSQS